MIDDGELITYMQQQEHTSRVFPLRVAETRRLLTLPNNNLPTFSDEINPRYWFQPSDFVSATTASSVGED